MADPKGNQVPQETATSKPTTPPPALQQPNATPPAVIPQIGIIKALVDNISLSEDENNNWLDVFKAVLYVLFIKKALQTLGEDVSMHKRLVTFQADVDAVVDVLKKTLFSLSIPTVDLRQVKFTKQDLDSFVENVFTLGTLSNQGSNTSAQKLDVNTTTLLKLKSIINLMVPEEHVINVSNYMRKIAQSAENPTKKISSAFVDSAIMSICMLLMAIKSGGTVIDDNQFLIFKSKVIDEILNNVLSLKYLEGGVTWEDINVALVNGRNDKNAQNSTKAQNNDAAANNKVTIPAKVKAQVDLSNGRPFNLYDALILNSILPLSYKDIINVSPDLNAKAIEEDDDRAANRRLLEKLDKTLNVLTKIAENSARPPVTDISPEIATSDNRAAEKNNVKNAKPTTQQPAPNKTARNATSQVSIDKKENENETDKGEEDDNESETEKSNAQTVVAAFKSDFKLGEVERLWTDLNTFYKRMKVLADTRYTSDFVEFKKYVDDQAAKADPPDAEEQGKSEINETLVLSLVKEVLGYYRRCAKEVYQFHFDFMVKQVRRKLAYMDRWRESEEFDTIQDHLKELKAQQQAIDNEEQKDVQAGGSNNKDTKESKQEAKQEAKKAVTKDLKATAKIIVRHDFDDIDAMLSDIKDLAFATLVQIRNAKRDTLASTNYVNLEEQEDKDLVGELDQKTDAYLDEVENKMSILFNRELSIMDLVLDNEFMAIYALKLVVYGFIAASLFLSERIFSEMYMKSVYGNGENPPDLLKFVGIFLGVNIALTLFLVTILVLLWYIFKNPSNNFIINPHLIKTFLMDFAIIMVLLILFAIIIGMTIQKKKYFRYKTEGLRGVRALKEIMLGVGALISMMPYFALF